MIAEIFQYEWFDDPAVAKAFREHSNARKFHARRVFLFAGPFAYSSYSYLDHLVAGTNAEIFMAVRLLLVVPTMLIIAWAFATGRCKGMENFAFLLYMLPVVISVVFMCVTLQDPAASLYPVGMVVTALFIAMLLLPTFRFTLLMVVVVMTGLFVVLAFSNMSQAAIYTTLYFFLMSCSVLLVGMFFHENTERRQFKFERRLEETIQSLSVSEQRAVDLYHEAKQAEKAKSEFLAVVSHELRTPMNAIIGFSEIISKEMLGSVSPRQYQEYAVHINDSGQQLLTIINDILDISRAEMGKIAFEHRVFDIASTVNSAIAACSANARDENVTVLRANPCLRYIEIEGDEARLLQAMTNIIGNAIKFSHAEGTVTVDLCFTLTGALCFSATDRGIGISEEDIEQIRQPFQQAESAFARKNGGLGLGLAICNLVASAHEGALQIDSTLGEGTTVSIVLPPDCVVPAKQSQTAA